MTKNIQPDDSTGNTHDASRSGDIVHPGETPPSSSSAVHPEPDAEWPKGKLPEQKLKWDLVQAARVFDWEVYQSVKRSQIGIYAPPKYVVWGQELCAHDIPKGGKDAAATCALELGLSRLRREFPELAKICSAHRQVLKGQDPETMDWFESFGTVSVDPGPSGTREQPYKRHIPEELAKQLGNLADELGMSNSKLCLLVLMAAQLGATNYVKPVYQEAIVTTLRRFAGRLKRRAARAQEYAEVAASAEPEPEAREYSIDDVVDRRRRKSTGRNDNDNDEEA